MNRNKPTGRNPSAPTGATGPAGPAQGRNWLSIIAWVVAIGLVVVAIFLGWRSLSGQAFAKSEPRTNAKAPLATHSANNPTSKASSSDGSSTDLQPSSLPTQSANQAVTVIDRHADLHTIIPNRPDEEVKSYTVEKGDSVFGIAHQFNIKPETLLWSNYSQLNDNPDLISLGMVLNIPPADGVLYTWKDGDTLDGVAGQFKVSPEAIVSWPGNDLDLTAPKIEPGALVMVPGGQREFRQWIIPTIARGHAGVSPSVYGAGACEGGYSGANGSGAFIWPAGNHSLSGNDYWSGHLGIDIAAGEGAPVYAADAGVVVFAGWSTGGYGNMVMIDHGNGYQTVYGHLSSVKVGCGQSVGAGSILGYAGSTGNSTGPHLHFEVRYQGGFVNPWYVLPAP